MQRNPSCPHCSKNYRGQDPVGSLYPCMLVCSHTFCRSCLTKLLKMSRTHIVCPICKTSTPTPLKEASISQLQPDFYVLGVLLTNSKKQMNINHSREGKWRKHEDSSDAVHNIPEAYKKFKEKVMGEDDEICLECIKKPASCMCETCKIRLCGECFHKIHRSSRTLMTHQAIQLQPKLSTNKCRQHSMKPLDFFCLEDMIPVCANCVIVGSHKGHSVQSIEERNKEAVTDLEPAMMKAEETMKTMFLTKKTISEAIPEVKHETSKVMNEVCAHFTRLHAILQVREKLLMESIESYLETQIDTIKHVQASVEANLSCVIGAISEAQKAINSNEYIQTTQLLALLDATADLPSFIEVLSKDNQLEFTPGPEDLSNNLSEYGEIEGFDTDRYTLKTFSEVPEEIAGCRELSKEDQAALDRMLLETQRLYKESVGSQSVENEDSESVSSSLTNLSKREGEANKTRKPYRPRTYLPRVPPGEKVIVTHIRNPCDFMVQRLGDQGKVNNMMGYLQKFCRAPADKLLTTDYLKIGTMVCCQYSFDKKWYRAIIMTPCKTSTEDEDEIESKDGTTSEVSVGSASMKSITSSRGKDKLFEVVYIDYGNTEWVPITSIRKMCPKYRKMPEFSKRCSLKDIVPAQNKQHWSKAAVHVFAEMTNNKPLLMTTIAHEGSIVYVDLHEVLIDDVEAEAPASVRDALVFLEVACFMSEKSVYREIRKKSVEYFTPTVPLKDEYVDVMVSHVNSPVSFYVQEITLGEQYLQIMMNELQKHYNNADNNMRVMCPHNGMLCVAKYNLDDLWYRSKVVGLPGEGMVDVNYVDFGNISRVHVSDVRMMTANFLKLPIQAIPCTMVDIAPIACDWDEGSANRLAELASTPMVISVQDVKDGVVSVLLYAPEESTDSSCINAVLVAEGFAKSIGPGSINAAVFKKYQKKGTDLQKKPQHAKISQSQNVRGGTYLIKNADAMKKASESKKLPYAGVQISHVISPSCFYVHLKTDGANDLESLQKAMVDEFLKTEVESAEWSVGDIGAMIYSSNDFYNRAKITKLLPEKKAKVEMIDYGNITVVSVSKLRRLSPDLSSVPPFAIRCHLANVFPAGAKEWTKTACEYFAVKLEELECYILKEDEMNEDGSFPIDLLYKKSWKEIAKGDDETQDTELVSELLINDGLALPSPQRKRPSSRVEHKLECDEEALIAHSKLSKYCSSSIDNKHEEPATNTQDKDYDCSSDGLLREDEDSSILEEHLPEVDQESQCSNDEFISSHRIYQSEEKKEIVDGKKQKPLGCVSDHDYNTDDGSIHSIDSDSSDKRSLQHLDKCSVHSLSKDSVHSISKNSIHSISKDSVHSIGKNSVHSIGKDSVHSIGKDSVHSIGKDSVHSIGKDSVHSIGKDSVHSIGKDSVHSIGKDSVHSIGKDSVHSTCKDSVHSIGKDSVHSIGKDSVHSTCKDSVHSIGKDSVHSTCKDSVHSIGKDSVHSIGKDSVHSISKVSVHSIGKVSVHSIGKDSVHSIGKDSVHSIGKDSVHSIGKDIVGVCKDSVHSIDKNSIVTLDQRFGSGRNSAISVDSSACHTDESSLQGSEKERVLGNISSSAQTFNDRSIHSKTSGCGDAGRSGKVSVSVHNDGSQQDLPKDNINPNNQSTEDNSGAPCSQSSSVQSSTYNTDASYEPSSDNAIDSKSTPQNNFITDKLEMDIDQIFTPRHSSTLPERFSKSDSSSDIDDEMIKQVITRSKEKTVVRSRKKKSVREKNPSQAVAPKSIPFVQYSPFEMPSNPCDIVVTYINEQGAIFGHDISEGKILLKEIMEELQNICSKRPVESGITWRPGQACFAQFSLDELWYRGKVLSVQQDIIWVQYVDFGNSEGVTADKLRTATCYTEIPHQCLECILYGSRIVNSANCWPTDALKFMYENLTICRIERKGVWQRGMPLMVMVTMPNGLDLHDALISGPLYNSQDVVFYQDNDFRLDAQRLAAMSENERSYYLGKSTADFLSLDSFCCDSSMEFIMMQLPEPGSLFDVTITHADAPNMVYIQHFQGHTENPVTRDSIRQLNHLIEMNAEIHHLAAAWPVVFDPYVGLCCAGLYGQDNQWYRAKILKISPPNSITVQYVDFGTAERVTLDRLRHLPVEYFDLPVQSVLCEVFGLQPPSDIADDCEMLPTTDWPLASLTRLLEVIAEKEQVAKVVRNGPVPLVCLYQGFVATSPQAKNQALPCNYVFLPLIDENLAEHAETDSGSEV
ncbi:uncharacterized protein [Antedon mediterranea]|uniref:uncharacterized protein n=1 Tax=Antedon mediterranea TaxID=105859 RepID=UPI003AF6BCF9